MKDTLLVDTRSENTPKLENIVEAVNEKNEKKDNARIGFARFDVLKYEDHVTFGTWNPRPLVDSQVKDLENSFWVNGLNRFHDKNLIPIVVNKVWLKNGTYSETSDTGQSLPELKFTDKIPKDWKVKAASGQHHVAALKRWLEQRQSELTGVKAELEKLMSQDAQTLDRMDLDLMNNAKKKERDELEGIIAYNGSWIVALYDEGKSIQIFLSTIHSAQIRCILDLREMHVQNYNFSSSFICANHNDLCFA